MLILVLGGQKFIPHTLTKVRELRELIVRSGSQALIEVDGGVNLETGSQLVEAGADVLVAGNAVFKAPDMVDMIRRLNGAKIINGEFSFTFILVRLSVALATGIFLI